MATKKKDLDWGNLDFSYRKTDYSYVSNYKDGVWDEGCLTADHNITLSECAGIFHYCQEVFEGLKAYATADGSIVCFRPDMNARRMADSAERLVMPAFPKDRFVEAVKQVVKANAAWVPPFGSGASSTCRSGSVIATGDVSRRQACRRVPVPHPRDARRPVLQGRRYHGQALRFQV